MVMGEVEGYANIDLSDKSKGSTASASDEWKQKPSFTVGGSYAWSGYTFFAEVESGKVEDTQAGATTKVSAMDYRVGAGRVMEINPTARIIMDASVVSTSEKTEVDRKD